MANSLTSASKNLSWNVQNLRKIRNLSQEGLAKLALVPRSTVTYLESGLGNPSLHNLIRIAGALQVSIEELLQQPRANCQLIQKNSIPLKKRGNGLVTVFKLLPDPVPGMELNRMEIQPGGRMGGTPHIPHTKEYLICMVGELEVAVGGTKYHLVAGDVLAFSGDQPHSYFNTGKNKSESVSVVVLVPHGV